MIEIKQSQIQQEQETDDIEETETIKEKVNLTKEIPLQDEETEKVSDDIYNSLVNIETREIPEEEHSNIKTIYLQNQQAEFLLSSNGLSKSIKVYPALNNVSYSIELRDNKNNLLHQILDIKKPYETNLKLLEGNYILSIKTQKDNMPFTIITE